MKYPAVVITTIQQTEKDDFSGAMTLPELMTGRIRVCVQPFKNYRMLSQCPADKSRLLLLYYCNFLPIFPYQRTVEAKYRILRGFIFV